MGIIFISVIWREDVNKKEEWSSIELISLELIDWFYDDHEILTYLVSYK